MVVMMVPMGGIKQGNQEQEAQSNAVSVVVAVVVPSPSGSVLCRPYETQQGQNQDQE